MELQKIEKANLLLKEIGELKEYISSLEKKEYQSKVDITIKYSNGNRQNSKDLKRLVGEKNSKIISSFETQVHLMLKAQLSNKLKELKSL